MTRFGKGLFGITVILLWAIVAALGLELMARWECRLIERAGLRTPVHPDWNPPPGAVETPPETNTGPLTASPSVPEAEDHLGTRFASMNEEDRILYAQLREETIVVYGTDGRAVSAYGREDTMPALGFDLRDVRDKALNELLVDPNTPVLPVIESAIRQARPVTVTALIPLQGASPRVVEASLYPFGGHGHNRVVCVFRDITHMPLTERTARSTFPDEDPVWKVPWQEYRKNLAAGGVRFTNNVGFRDDDVTLPKPPGVFRIVCIGGSTTLEGGSIGTTYPNQVERALRDRFRTNTIEVINCGVGGIGSLGECRRTPDYIRLEPDIAIHYNFVNDLCHNFFPLWDEQATARQRILRCSMFINLHINNWLLPPPQRIEEQYGFLTFRNLRRMRDAFARRGIETLFCSFACPDYPNLTREERRFFESVLRKDWQGRYVSLKNYVRLTELYNERLRAFCEETGSNYVPVAEHLKGGVNFFTDICHMTPAGIGRKAEIITDYLAQNPRVAGRISRSGYRGPCGRSEQENRVPFE